MTQCTQLMLAEKFLKVHSDEESFISKDFKQVFSTSKIQIQSGSGGSTEISFMLKFKLVSHQFDVYFVSLLFQYGNYYLLQK